MEIMVVDTIISIDATKIYSKNSPRYDEKVWIINCKENKIKILASLGNNKVLSFIEKIPTGTLTNRKYCFTVSKVANYLLDVEEVKK